MTVAPRGRPRSAAADQAILDAVLKLLGEHGYGGLTMEGVAAEAGVGKTTVYRRYSGKDDMVTAAIACLTEDDDVPDSGDTRADVLEMLRRFVAARERKQSMRLLGTLFLERDRNPELLELFRERVIEPRRSRMVAVIERGRARGELRPEVDPALAAEMMIGAYFARMLNGLPFPRDWAEQVVEQIWPALEAH
jgi:AcrR family transcriptional regulator